MEKRLPLPAGTVLQGRYRILRQLGHGGFGAVYEAVDDELNLSFALKETFYAADEELRQAFKREARMLASLSHEAFPRVTHYFTEGDGCFLVMELIQGDDLDKLLAKRSAPFEQEQILTWADQILDALEDLHVGGIIHRDIKPSNLKLTPRGRIKLLDFGIAKGALEGETTALNTVGSMAAATLQYAPLEQVLKASLQHQMMLAVISPEKVAEIMKQGTGAVTDLFALAATLYHLLTKTLPADAPTRALAIWSGQGDRLIPAFRINPMISKEVSDILQQALEIDRTARPASAAQMRQMLKAASIVTSAAAEPAQTQPSPRNLAGLPENPFPQKFTVEPLNPLSPEEIQDLPKSPDYKPKNTFRNIVLIGIGTFFISFVILFLVLGIRSYRNSSASNSSASNSNPEKTVVEGKFELAQTLTSSDMVTSVAFSPDGKTIAGGSLDNTVKLWNAATGVLKQTLIGHSNMMNSVAFSPDGKTIASGSNDKTIKLWDAASGSLKQTLNGHSDFVESVAFSPDGKTIASGSTDHTIKLWDAASSALKQTFTTNDKVYSVAFSPDGKTIAGAIDDHTIKLWDAVSGALKQNLTGHSQWITSVAFSPDGKTIVSGSNDKTIKLWDAASGALKQTLTVNYYVDSVAFSPDGKTIASGSQDKTIKLWDAASGALKQTLNGHDEVVRDVVFSPDGKTIASGSQDKTIKLWRVK